MITYWQKLKKVYVIKWLIMIEIIPLWRSQLLLLIDHDIYNPPKLILPERMRLEEGKLISKLYFSTQECQYGIKLIDTEFHFPLKKNWSKDQITWLGLGRRFLD